MWAARFMLDAYCRFNIWFVCSFVAYFVCNFGLKYTSSRRVFAGCRFLSACLRNTVTHIQFVD